MICICCFRIILCLASMAPSLLHWRSSWQSRRENSGTETSEKAYWCAVTQLFVNKNHIHDVIEACHSRNMYFLWQNNRNTSCSFSPYTKLLGQSKLATAQLKNDTKGKLTLHLVSALMWTILRMLWISNQTPDLSISTYF